MPRKKDEPENFRTDEDEAPGAIALGDDLPGEGRTHEDVEHDKSPVGKLKADVEPMTDVLAAVEALVKGLAGEFKGIAGTNAGEIEALAESFAAEAKALAEAALANVEGKLAAGTAERGYDPQLKIQPDLGPAQNEHAVRSAVAHGMDEETARAMTHPQSNI